MTVSFRRALFAVMTLAFSCAPDVGSDPSGTAVRIPAVFEPTLGIVPTPTDLLLDPVTGLVKVPETVRTRDGTDVAAFPPSMVEFARTYLDTLDGAVPESPLEVSLSAGEIRWSTATAAAFRVFDITDPKAIVEVTGLTVKTPSDPDGLASSAGKEPPDNPVVQPTVTASGLSVWNIRVVPPVPWTPGHRYAAFLRNRVLDKKGNPIVSPVTFNFLKAVDPLVTDKGAAVPPVTDTEAAQLEAIRLALKPVLDLFESQVPESLRVSRQDTVLAWVFTVASASSLDFDPSASRIPMPNDLLKDPKTGRLAFPTPTGAKCDDPASFQTLGEADRISAYFFCWMNTLDGFSATSTAEARFLRPLDPKTVTMDNAKIFDVSGAKPVEVSDATLSLSEDGRTIRFTPTVPFTPGHRLLVVLSRGLRGTTDGKTYVAVPSAAMAMLLLSKPLSVDGKSQMPGLLSDPDSVRFEAIRAGYAPLLDALAAAGWTRDRIAGFFTFTVAGGNEALFDSRAGIIPMPDDVLLDPETGRVALPIDPSAPQAIRDLTAGLNTLDGFSTVAPVSIPFASPLDPQFLGIADNLVAFKTLPIGIADITDVNADDPATFANLVIYGPDRFTASARKDGTLVLTPAAGRPLPPGRRFLVALSSALRTLGDTAGKNPIQVSPTLKLIQSPYPVATEAGASLLPQVLTDADAKDLEKLRRLYAPLFDALGLVGLKRDDVLQMFTFVTQTIEPGLDDIVRRLDVPILWGGTLKYPTHSEVKKIFGANSVAGIDRVCTDCALNAEILLESPDLTDPKNPKLGKFAYKDGKPAFRTGLKLPFILILPEGKPPFPIVVFQHGVGGAATDVVKIASDLASAGFAVIALDAPYHGGHPVRIDGAASGEGFFSADVFATRDAIREAVLDQYQATRFIRERLDPFLAEQMGRLPADPPVVKTDAIGYLGVSLGGIIGTVSIGMNPHFKRAALVVTGGHLVRVFLETQNTDFQMPLIKALAALGIAPGSSAFDRFTMTAQWALDRADPVNFARLAALPELPAADRVLMIEAAGDEFIPNTTTAELRDAFSAETGKPPKLIAFPEQGGSLCHGFFLDSCDTAKFPTVLADQAAARKVVTSFLSQVED